MLAGAMTAASAALLVTAAAMGELSILGFGGDTRAATSHAAAPGSSAGTGTRVVHRSRNIYDNFIVNEPTTLGPGGAPGSGATSDGPTTPSANGAPDPGTPAPGGAPSGGGSSNDPAPPSHAPTPTTRPTTPATGGPPASAAPTTVPATTAPPTQTSETLSTPGGDIKVLVSGTTITIVGVQPGPGYQYDVGGTSTRPRVHFENGGTEMNVYLTVSNGQVQSQVVYDH